MYNKFFGFTEKPFKLVPDPVFLFLSKSHEEALAHLTYAVSQGDGFVAITGEVGTGKTTLCRAFLESLDDSFEAAYIFNPKLDAVQLLKSINDEFAIPSNADNVKDLIDTLNAFLLKKKAAGRNIILIIDEAHNLDDDVLEQIRLLSNLETTRQKLIQIILIGQPELDDMLDLPKLRQLEQRIALRYHLSPLNLQETQQYITHRLAIASQKAVSQFSAGAISQIYKYSAGIPRLINILCDRALLIAFCAEKRSISRATVRKAIHELSAKNQYRPAGRRKWKTALSTVGVICGMALIGLLVYANIHDSIGSVFKRSTAPTAAPPKAEIPSGMETKQTAEPVVKQVKPDAKQAETALIAEKETAAVAETAEPGPVEHAETPAPVLKRGMAANAGTAEPEPVEHSEAPTPLSAAQEVSEKIDEPTVWDTPSGQSHPKVKVASLVVNVENFNNYLINIEPQQSKRAALASALTLWGNPGHVRFSDPAQPDDYAYFQLGAREKGFGVQRVGGDLALIERLNLPAIFALQPETDSPPVHMTASRFQGEEITLMNGESIIRVTKSQLLARWNGMAYVLWKDHLVIRDIIPLSYNGDSVITLKLLLHNIGYKQISIDRVFDADTREAVQAIQDKYGILPDGIVGPMTKIVLYNELDTFKTPRLTDPSKENIG